MPEASDTESGGDTPNVSWKTKRSQKLGAQGTSCRSNEIGGVSDTDQRRVTATAMARDWKWTLVHQLVM